MTSYSWSPDSKHLIIGNFVVTSFDKPPISGGDAPGWIDSNHLISLVLPADNSTARLEKVLIAEIRADEIFYYDSGLLYQQFVIIRPKH